MKSITVLLFFFFTVPVYGEGTIATLLISSSVFDHRHSYRLHITIFSSSDATSCRIRGSAMGGEGEEAIVEMQDYDLLRLQNALDATEWDVNIDESGKRTRLHQLTTVPVDVPSYSFVVSRYEKERTVAYKSLCPKLIAHDNALLAAFLNVPSIKEEAVGVLRRSLRNKALTDSMDLKVWEAVFPGEF